MKPGRGKGKGSSFERETARTLSMWLTGGADDKQLIRSVLSGGWGRGKVGDEAWRHAGDLAPNGPYGEVFRKLVAVECKHHRQIDLYGLWTKKAQLTEWWTKLCEEAAASNTAPWLIFRANLRPTMLMMRTAQFTDLNESAQLLTYKSDVKAMAYDAWGITFMPLELFLKHTPPGLVCDDAIFDEMGKRGTRCA